MSSLRLARSLRRGLVITGAAGALLIATPLVASAHPLGNFTINHYLGVTLHPSSVDVLAVVDTAEIPTAQARGSLDLNHDGKLGADEAQAHATTACATAAQQASVSVAGSAVALAVRSSSFGYRAGAAALPTGRLECRLSGAASISRSTQVLVTDGSPTNRIGWHEITVRGDGVSLQRSPVPATSVSDELRKYPNDLLSSPLNVREAALTVLPGAGASTYGTFSTAPRAGFFGRTIGAIDREFGNLVGRKHATLTSIGLAALLALILGAAHASLPGHGKTIMAAYLAGRRGSTRDAVLVGATVTITHTVGVLLLGLALSLSSALAGDVVTQRLALVSGLIVVLVGVGLLRSALRGDHGHSHGPGGHTHGPQGHDHPHDDVHSHADDHDHPHGDEHSHAAGHDHAHEAGGHDHPHEHSHDDELLTTSNVALLSRTSSPAVVSAPVRRFSRAGLVGMGIAGGLVPSPSALVVLLSAIALGRAWLGVVLVLLYGVGMAGTLTGIGLLLVKAGDRVQRRFLEPGPVAQRVFRLLPIGTASAVIAVGVLLTLRAV